MPTTVTIPQPIRADVDEAVVPHCFDAVTSEPFVFIDGEPWNDEGQLVVHFPTVDLEDEQVNEIIRLARQEPAIADLGVDVPLPAQLIPAGDLNIAASQISSDRMQANVSVAGELWVAEYASEDPGETEPSETSSVTKMSAGTGFRFLQPTYTTDELAAERAVDPAFEQTWIETVAFPSQAFDQNGSRIAAVFRGRVEADTVAILRALTIQGDATAGEWSHISPNAALVMDNLITDPDTQPDISFGPKTQNWPGLTSEAQEIGWGIHSGQVVTARHNSGNLLQARFIDPDTGNLDHDQDMDPYYSVAGFTAGGGKLWVLAKFIGSEGWKIRRYSPNGIYDDAIVDAPIDGRNTACLGFDGGNVLLFGTGGSTPSVRVYDTNLNQIDSYQVTGLGDAPGKAVGVGTDWVAHGNRWSWLAAESGGARARIDTQSWFSYIGTMTGAGELPSGQFAATNQTGRLAKFNPDRIDSLSDILTRWSKYDTSAARESAVSPFVAVIWPARMYATITSGPVAPGTDDVRIYAHCPADEFGYVLVPKNLGQTTVTIANASGAVVTPPSTSDFTDGTGTSPGCIESETTGGSSGAALTKACGDGAFHAKKAFQAGVKTCNITAPLGDNEEFSVVYDVPFEATPSVTVTLGPVPGLTADPQQFEPTTVRVSSATGFTVAIRRFGGNADADVLLNWQAMAVTQ